MSKFLGKIHYWLFNKILWFENLEHRIVDWAGKEGQLPVEQWKEEIYAVYGPPVEGKPLEEIIDTGNIHGWLQDKISRAELRHASWVTRILGHSAEFKRDLARIFEEQGSYAGSEYAKEGQPESPEEVFNILNDFILEGMPCDHVNKELENTEEVYRWTATSCLHKPYWDEAGGDVANFYQLRETWVEAFVKALSHKFVYQVTEAQGRRIQEIKKANM